MLFIMYNAQRYQTLITWFWDPQLWAWDLQFYSCVSCRTHYSCFLDRSRFSCTCLLIHLHTILLHSFTFCYLYFQVSNQMSCFTMLSYLCTFKTTITSIHWKFWKKWRKTPSNLTGYGANNKSVQKLLLMVNYLLSTCKLSTDQPVYVPVLLIDNVPNAAG